MTATLTILGSGTMMPTKNRFPSCYLLEAEGLHVLLDCGHMTIPRLMEHHVSLHDIDAIVLTHFHGDHIAHLLPIIFARFVDATERGLKQKTLKVIGPPTLLERYRKLREVMWPENQHAPVELIETGNKSFEIASLKFTPFAVVHSPLFPCQGYRIATNGKILVYTGDMGCDQAEGLKRNLQNADVLVIEAGADLPSPSHCTPERAMEFGIHAGAKRIFLTHVSAWRTQKVQEAIAPHAPRVQLAEDGMRIIIE